jgi:hypothetical protein
MAAAELLNRPEVTNLINPGGPIRDRSHLRVVGDGHDSGDRGNNDDHGDRGDRRDGFDHLKGWAIKLAIAFPLGAGAALALGILQNLTAH